MITKAIQKRRAYNRARYAAIKSGEWVVHKHGVPKEENRVVCSHCGKTFLRPPSNQRSGNQYCGMDCMAKAYVGRNLGASHPNHKGTKTKPCVTCGKPNERPMWMWKYNEQVFCDSKCFGKWKSLNWSGENNPSWKGGKHHYYGPNWKRQARRTRHRDNHKCRRCGVDESELRRALDVHHLKPFRFFGLENYKKANMLVNLVSLCENCHHTVEHYSERNQQWDWGEIIAECGGS